MCVWEGGAGDGFCYVDMRVNFVYLEEKKKGKRNVRECIKLSLIIDNFV